MFILHFQFTHDDMQPLCTDRSSHGASFHQLLFNVSLHDLQCLVMSERDPWCWYRLLPVWLAQGHRRRY